MDAAADNLNTPMSAEDAQKSHSATDNEHSIAIFTKTEEAPLSSKRTRSSEDDECFKSPYNADKMLMRQPKKIFCKQLSSLNVHLNVMSPITEISMNLSETKLQTPQTSPIGKITDNNRSLECNTPKILRTWRKAKSFQQKLFTEQGIENDAEETNFDSAENDDQQEKPSIDKLPIENDCTQDLPEKKKFIESFQMPARNNEMQSKRGTVRQLFNTDASPRKMVVDELSFYDDDQENCATRLLNQRSPLPPSPTLIGLLSPETSPQRFQILEKKTIVNDKFLQSVAGQQMLTNFSNSLSTTSSNTNNASNSTTPAISLRMFHSLSSGSMESSIDDDYMDMFEMESLEQESEDSILKFPRNLHSLISGQIKSSNTPFRSGRKSSIGKKANCTATDGRTPEMRRPSVRRCLSMTENNLQEQPKTPELLKPIQETTSYNTTPFSSRLSAESGNKTSDNDNSSFPSNACFKRPEPPNSSTCSPVLSKRYRGSEKENLPEGCTLLTSTATSTASTAASVAATQVRPPLRKCISLNDAEIMSALSRVDDKDGPDLIGDFSKPFALPLLEGRHRDLKSISSDTVAYLLNGGFDEQISSYSIVDCRYPYEFEGGHIRGAKNLYTHEQIIEEFLTQQKTEQEKERADCAGSKRNIIIFHCEFSSERGPKLSRFLRNNDRLRNTSTYPALEYPEIYLLHNGYKEFYETHSELCDPVAYRPMLEPSFSEAYRHFRAKSKSWNGDGLGGGTTSRMKKSRSRLLL